MTRHRPTPLLATNSQPRAPEARPGGDPPTAAGKAGVIPTDSLLALLAGHALLEQGFSPSQAAGYAALGMRREIHELMQIGTGEPTGRERMAARWERHAADVTQARAASMQATAPRGGTMREARGSHVEQRSAITSAADRTAAK